MFSWGWNPHSVFSGLHFVNLRVGHFSLLLRNSPLTFQSRDYNLAPWSPQSCDHLSPLWGHLVEQLLTCWESQRERNLSLLPGACLKGCLQQVPIRTCVNLTTLSGFRWHFPRIWTSFSIFFWDLVFLCWFSNCCHFRTGQWKGVVSHLSCVWHSWRIWCYILFGHIPKWIVGLYCESWSPGQPLCNHWAPGCRPGTMAGVALAFGFLASLHVRTLVTSCISVSHLDSCVKGGCLLSLPRFRGYSDE